jgi:hypothetical protein
MGKVGFGPRRAVSFRSVPPPCQSRKLRVVIVSDDLLSRVSSTPMPALEHHTHATRWETLKCMAQIREKELANEALAKSQGVQASKPSSDKVYIGLGRIQMPVPYVKVECQAG